MGYYYDHTTTDICRSLYGYFGDVRMITDQDDPNFDQDAYETWADAQDDPNFDQDAYETWADAQYDQMKDDKADEDYENFSN